MALKRGLRWATPSLWSGAEKIERELRQELVLEGIDEKTDNIEARVDRFDRRPLPQDPVDTSTLPTQGAIRFQMVPPLSRDPGETTRRISDALEAELISRRMQMDRLDRIRQDLTLNLNQGGFRPTLDLVYEAARGRRQEPEGAEGGYEAVATAPPGSVLDVSVALSGSSAGYHTPRSSPQEALQSGGTPNFLEFVSE